MIWRLIRLIFVAVILLLFIAFNIKNTSDINFGFAVLRDVPVFLTAFFSAVFGILCTLPIILTKRSQKKPPQDKTKVNKIESKADIEIKEKIDSKQYGID